jgi:ankyrin repeat protein
MLHMWNRRCRRRCSLQGSFLAEVGLLIVLFSVMSQEEEDDHHAEELQLPRKGGSYNPFKPAQEVHVSSSDDDDDDPNLPGSSALGDFAAGAKADFGASGINFEFPLHKACQQGNLETVKDLAEGITSTKKNVNEKDDFGWTPLFYAVESAHTHIVTYLISQKASVRLRDNDSRNLLHHAAIGNNPTLIQTLARLGCDVNLKDSYGDVPLFYTVRAGFFEATEAIMAAGADVNAKGLCNDTALHWAAKRNNEDLVRLLLHKGAKKKSPDDRKTNPYDWARQAALKDMLRPTTQAEPPAEQPTAVAAAAKRSVKAQ